jgi:hypothetical protein
VLPDARFCCAEPHCSCSFFWHIGSLSQPPPAKLGAPKPVLWRVLVCGLHFGPGTFRAGSGSRVDAVCEPNVESPSVPRYRGVQPSLQSASTKRIIAHGGHGSLKAKIEGRVSCLHKRRTGWCASDRRGGPSAIFSSAFPSPPPLVHGSALAHLSELCQRTCSRRYK